LCTVICCIENLFVMCVGCTDCLRHKIKNLRGVVRQRERKIVTLSEALDACQQRNLLTDEASSNLSESFSPTARELILILQFY